MNEQLIELIEALKADVNLNRVPEYYYLTFNGKPIDLGNIRLYKNEGGPKTALLKFLNRFFIGYNMPIRDSDNKYYKELLILREKFPIVTELSKAYIEGGKTYCNDMKQYRPLRDLLLAEKVFEIKQF